eukprot:1161655-Pelagomonas_calceolata.AAC.12
MLSLTGSSRLQTHIAHSPHPWVCLLARGSTSLGIKWRGALGGEKTKHCLQTQTAECMVVGEIATSNLIVALNKCDMLPEDNRPKAVKKAQKRLAQTFDMTKFAGATMVPMTARQGTGECAQSGDLLLMHAAFMAGIVSPNLSVCTGTKAYIVPIPAAEQGMDACVSMCMDSPGLAE